MEYSSKILEQAVREINRLPGIGGKTALRLALHLIKQEESDIESLTKSITNLKETLKQCTVCFNISDKDICDICANLNRDRTLICVVEDIRDVMALENAGSFKGLYHVLGGLISPMDGIGPSNLSILDLLKRLDTGEVKEVVLALNATMEGDTTNFYLYRKINNLNLTVTTIARGIGVGDTLEYTDEITLGRSMQNRIPFEQTMHQG